MSKEVRVGTGLILVKDGKMLLGRRRGSHAAGLYSFPGGHLDWNETWEQGVLRELEEECGPNVKVRLRPIGLQRAVFITNNPMPQYDKHYITIFMVADWVEGEPENTEPHKCDGWEWFNFDQLAELAQHNECSDWIPMDYMEFYREQIGV